MKMRRGEDYHMQIDSHMIFKKDWDVLAIQVRKKGFGAICGLPRSGGCGWLCVRGEQAMGAFIG